MQRKKSREFELLVTRIESSLAPAGAIVKSPDRIRDKITGQYREVDASIKYKVGSCDLLLTIECRDRSRKQDVTWIEQLATKRSHINADRTIAVSSTAFSEAAIKAASAHNISLRQIKELNDTEIKDLISVLEVEVNYVRINPGRLSLTWLTEPEKPLELDGDTLKSFHSLGWNAPIFYSNSVETPQSLNNLIAQTDGAREFLNNVPLDGSIVEKSCRLEIVDEQISVLTKNGPSLLREISIWATAQYRSEKLPVSKASQYIDGINIITTLTEHSIELSPNHRFQILSNYKN